MISVDFDLMIGSTEVGSPFLESFNYGHKLLVVNLVVEFWSIELLGEESNRVK